MRIMIKSDNYWYTVIWYMHNKTIYYNIFIVTYMHI